nr:MAG TPA: hypothetical protein [Caudoviricetes sp.]
MFTWKKLYAYFSILHNYHLVLSTGYISGGIGRRYTQQ